MKPQTLLLAAIAFYAGYKLYNRTGYPPNNNAFDLTPQDAKNNTVVNNTPPVNVVHNGNIITPNIQTPAFNISGL